MIKAFIALFMTFSVYSQTLTIVADLWCPFNCEPNSKKPGYMIEVIEKVFAKEGIKVVYKKMSWSRAVTNTRDGINNMVVGAYKSDVPDFIFTEQPLGFSGEAFYIHQDSSWEYSGENSLPSVKLAGIRDYSYGPAIDAYISKNKMNSSLIDIISGDDALDRNMRKLLKRRVTAVIENEYVMNYYFNNHKQYKSKIKKAGIAYNYKNVYAAFSPKIKNSKKYAKILSDGIKQLRESGELEKILKKYNLKDWD